MKVTKQGDNYEAEEELEDEEYEDGEEFDDEDEDEDDGRETVNTIFGLPKKLVFIGAAGVFVLVALFAVTSIMKKPKGDVEAEESTEAYTEEPVQTYDEFMAEGGYEGDEYSDGSQEMPQQTVNDILITDEDAAKLSTYGYTGSEIELAKEYGISVDDMIANAQSRQEASVRATIRKLSDTGSIEYQNLINQTYLGQEKNKEPVDQTKVDNPTYYETSQIINADYVKCPTYGLQLQLKCKVYDGVYIWYQVTPERWVSLPQSGNIVLSITLRHYGDSIYLTDVHETTSNPGTDSVQSDNLVNQPVE